MMAFRARGPSEGSGLNRSGQAARAEEIRKTIMMASAALDNVKGRDEIGWRHRTSVLVA